MIYSGTSGLTLPVKNKLSYPPGFQDKTRLTFYSFLFNSIEINSSFYKLPQPRTIEKWAGEVGSEFKFTFKLWKELTHNKGLAYDPSNVPKFLEVISKVNDKKGSLLIQFPPSVGIQNMRQLESLLRDIYQENLEFGWDVAVEFRSATLYEDEVFELLEEYRFAPVIHDKAGAANFLTDINTSFVYLRFHGPDGNYRGDYSGEYLHEFAEYISEWHEQNKTVYVYFNNTMGSAVFNLLSLNKILGF